MKNFTKKKTQSVLNQLKNLTIKLSWPHLENELTKKKLPGAITNKSTSLIQREKENIKGIAFV